MIFEPSVWVFGAGPEIKLKSGRLQALLSGSWLFGLKCIQCGLCHLKL